MNVDKKIKRLLKKIWPGVEPEPARPAAPPAKPGRTRISVDWAAHMEREPVVWQAALARAKTGPKVLIATSIGGHAGLTPVESMLAVALTMRGANVHFLLCDEFLPGCMQVLSTQVQDQAVFVAHGPQHKMCGSCFSSGQATYGPLGLPIHRYSDYVTADERQQAASVAAALPLAGLAEFKVDGLAIGEHALAGALRYFAKGGIEDEPQAEGVKRRFLHAALLSLHVTRRLLRAHKFDVACFNHGIYVPQGVIGEVARQEGVRVVNWVAAYRKKCFIFSHGDTYHHTLMNEPVSSWEDVDLRPDMEQELIDYLFSRWQGSKDWIWFHEKPEKDLSVISAEMGIDFSKPTIGLLTNVIWDAQLHYPANAFPSMMVWLRETIRYFIDRPELQLVIRVHPAEIRGTLPSRQGVVDEIARAFPALPPNIFVIPPESTVSTYPVMLACDSVIIYGTKTGVELTSLGVPVIVAGEAWIRNKGVTLDAQSADHYYELLDRLPLRRKLDEATTRRARLYAYHFFFRRMTPVAVMEPKSGWPPFGLEMSSLAEVSPGSDPGLDVICQGIIEGTDFIYPAERIAATQTA